MEEAAAAAPPPSPPSALAGDGSAPVPAKAEEGAPGSAFVPVTVVPEWARRALAVSVAHAEVLEAQLRLLSYSVSLHKKHASSMAQIVKQMVDSLPNLAKVSLMFGCKSQ